MSENESVSETPEEETSAEGPVATAEGQAESEMDQPLQDEPSGGQSKPIDLEFLLDIPLQVRVEIGRTRMLINDLLQLGQGSVIELQKFVGEPFEVLVNEKLVARGEIVVVNERFGVRLTDIISPMERIEQLG
ncbi:flagellar motor switch protein FliN [Candidatus Sumerlaeota bacterium]|nr:flagellar motor switch protein FliN [Candidatus Sumerlaeota bacterium]